MKDLIDRQKLLAEIYMAADGALHDVYRSIEGDETLYAKRDFNLAVSMIMDLPGIDADMIAEGALAKAEEKLIDLYQSRAKDHQAISYADICLVFQKLREGK